ncbi:agmatinase family protein [Priestia sp. YIM B13486]
MTYPYPQLNRPSFHWERQRSTEPKVSDWIETFEVQDEIDFQAVDVTVLGVPLSRSSISASGASETPLAMRQLWKSFNPYHIEYDTDLTSLSVLDLGDVKQHVTDISLSHQYIKEAMISMRKYHPHTLPIMLGGDHSITAMLVKGWKESHPEQRIGILQFDTHFDLRSLEDNGPSNGTPIRNLIESGNVEGKNVWNIGLHGFYNSKSLKEYADTHKVNYVTLLQARKTGISNTVEKALDDLAKKVDAIYLTVDMDVLDIAYAPGVPAGTTGGMRTDELFEAIYIAGSYPLVQAMDIVCLDPLRDKSGITVKAGVHVFLNFLTGFASRK